jgi:hypothetical protein
MSNHDAGTTPHTHASIRTAALALGVDAETADAAARNLAEGRVTLLLVSGKLGSGKDSVAPAVFTTLGITAAEHQYFALPLKEEVNQMMADLRTWWDTGRFAALTPARREQAAELIAGLHHMPLGHARFYTGEFLNQVLANRVVHSRSRTAVMRRALQYHGTECRRSQDENYWVKKALSNAVTALAAGTSVYFTDARFPNEVTVPAALGAISVRLDISPEVQRERIIRRDGRIEDPQALMHPSETSLDDFTGFNIRFRNEGTLQEAVDQVVAGIRAMRADTAAA